MPTNPRRRPRPLPPRILLAVNAPLPPGYVIPTPPAGLPPTRFEMEDHEAAATAPDDADPATEGTPMQLTFASPERKPSSALDDYLDQDLVPLREATRAGIKLGDITVIHRGDQRFVRRFDMDAVLSKRRRSNPAGAGAKIAAKISEATEQRANAVSAAQRARATIARIQAPQIV